MAEVWQLTRAEFVGDFKVDDSDLKDLDRTFQYEVEEFGAGWMPRTLRQVPSSPGFFFADVRGRPGDVVLIQQDPVDGEYDLVGGYIDEFLWVDGGSNGRSGVRGRGLGAELVLAKMEKVDVPFNVISYTSAGKSAHEAAHRLAVHRALKGGFRVPDKVLADYPDLAAGNQRRAQPRLLGLDDVAARLRARKVAAEAAAETEVATAGLAPR